MGAQSAAAAVHKDIVAPIGAFLPRGRAREAVHYCLRLAGAMPEVTAIADYNDLCGEGPLWDARESVLYWTDLIGRRVYRFHWPRREHAKLASDFEVCGFAFNEPDGFVVTNSEGIWLWNLKSDKQLIASEVEGAPCHMNDCIADPHGRIFTGSYFYDSNRPDYPLGHLMRVDTDRTVHLVDDGIHLANGLGFSPDCRTLYFADSVARRIFAYDYDADSGNVRNRRNFVEVPSNEGLPDGLTVDAEGFVWCAHWFGGCVIRYDPDGKIERRIAVPAKQTSSVGFGGPDLTGIFITSAAVTDSLELAPAGYDPRSGYVGGRLYYTNAGIQGRQEFRARIQ